MPQKIYYTYIMASASRNLYIGVTSNLERRVREHKEGALGSFTAKYRCHRLVWVERYSWIGQAIAREKRIEGLASGKEDSLDSTREPYMGRFERGVGHANQDVRRWIEKAGPSLRSG